MDSQQYDQSMMPQMPGPIAPIVHTGTSDNIASMRWESDPLIINLRITLGGYEVRANQEGQTLLQRARGVQPMVNDLGIDRFVGIIRGTVNPVVALSNIEDEEANTMIRQILYAIVSDMVYNKDRFEIHSGDMRTVMNIMKSLVFFQIKRPVSGHEARNFRTQTIEQNLSQNMNMQRPQGSPFNPFSWGKR